MALRSSLVREGFGMSQADALLGGTALALTAAGTTQATAVGLASSNNVFSTVGAGSGAILMNRDLGDDVLVVNLGANALLVYPPVGHSIQTLAVDAGFSVGAGNTCRFKRMSPTLWISSLSA